MVTNCDKGSDNVRLRSGSSHVMTKKTSIWVLICKEKRMKNRGKSDFHHKYYVHSLKIHPFSFTGICSTTYSPHAVGVVFVGSWTSLPLATFLATPMPPWTHSQGTSTLQGECAIISTFIELFKC